MPLPPSRARSAGYPRGAQVCEHYGKLFRKNEAEISQEIDEYHEGTRLNKLSETKARSQEFAQGGQTFSSWILSMHRSDAQSGVRAAGGGWCGRKF